MLISGFLLEKNRLISERAKNISGGEARRLSLLKILRNLRKINLFDKPRSSIDPEIAKPVWETIFKYISKNTLIVVTHDLKILHRFDKIIVMDKGKLTIKNI